MRTPGNYKAVRVFVNNAPDEYHIHRAKILEQWGKPSIAVCDSEDTAKFLAAAPRMYSELSLIARMKTEDEFDEDDKPASEDWICTLNALIERAREITREIEGDGTTDLQGGRAASRV